MQQPQQLGVLAHREAFIERSAIRLEHQFSRFLY
jgi:hypothetical protein